MNPVQQSSGYSRAVHVLAIVTCLVAVLPIGMGALTTTLKAGMAFPDWPTSDGWGMFSYPWLKDLRTALDKFVEHGHRLAGILIGNVAIVLVIVSWWKSSRRDLRWLSLAILLGVIAQGLLGGGRVRLNEQMLAMLHGFFAAVVFAMMVTMAVISSQRWECRHPHWTQLVPQESGVSKTMFVRVKTRVLILGLPCMILLQYLLGGYVRHIGTALHEHLAGAAVVFIMSVATIVAARRSGVAVFRRTTTVMSLVLVLQILLGLGAWVTRFGYAPMGYVAVVNSPAQMIVRSSHTFGGMLLFATAVTLAVVSRRVYYWQSLQQNPLELSHSSVSSTSPLQTPANRPSAESATSKVLVGVSQNDEGGAA